MVIARLWDCMHDDNSKCSFDVLYLFFNISLLSQKYYVIALQQIYALQIETQRKKKRCDSSLHLGKYRICCKHILVYLASFKKLLHVDTTFRSPH